MLPQLLCADGERRQARRLRDAVLRTRLFYLQRRTAEIAVVRQGTLDQGPQVAVWREGLQKRALLRVQSDGGGRIGVGLTGCRCGCRLRAAEGGRHADHRALVGRRQRAASRRRTGGDQAQARPTMRNNLWNHDVGAQSQSRPTSSTRSVQVVFGNYPDLIETTGQHAMTGKKVLLVEDDSDSASILRPISAATASMWRWPAMANAPSSCTGNGHRIWCCWT